MLFDIQSTKLRHEFASFIYGPDLADAVLAARRAACAKASAYLWGNAGSGKTHLLHAAKSEAARNDIVQVAVGDILPNVPSLAIVDDVTTLDDERMHWLFETLRSVLQGSSKTCALVSGPSKPPELGIRDDVLTRLQELPTYRLFPLDDDNLVRAICSHAARMGRELAEPVARILVERLPRDMASLSAAIEELDSYAIANGIKLSAQATSAWLDKKEGMS